MKAAMVPIAITVIGWVGGAILLASYFHQPLWLALVFPGSLVPINFLRSYLGKQDEEYGKRRGLEAVYRPNVHGKGSFFAGYRDPETGEWPVDPDLYPELPHDNAKPGRK